jgi:hypothetical protein
LVKALERNTAAILALAAVVAKGAHGTPVLNTDEAARDHVKRLLRQFEEP